MKIYKNITIGKVLNGSEDPKYPTHNLVCSEEGFKNKVTAGSLWTKEGQNGRFLSGVMGDARTYTNKEGVEVKVSGYVIVQEDELNALIAKAESKTDLEVINNETSKKLFGTELTAEDHEAMSNMVF